MLQVDGIDIEYPQIGREPQMGYADEYVEKVMVSGLVKRIYRGKRFYATFTYPFLEQDQITTIKQLLASQRVRGYVEIKISSPYGNYEGQAILELNSDQTRFKQNPDTGEFVWTNWSITAKGTRYDDN